MKKIIKLYQQIGKFQEKNAYIKVDEDLEIKLDCNKVNGSRLEAVIHNGESVKRIACKDNCFNIPSEFIRVGILKIQINVLLNGNIIKRYICEDLFVYEDEDRFELVPEIEAYKKEVQEYKSQVNLLTSKYDTLLKLVCGLYDIKVGGKNE